MTHEVLQVLTIKPKFVVDNQTGMAIEVKQKGSPDLDLDPYYGGERRCSCRLDINQRYCSPIFSHGLSSALCALWCLCLLKLKVHIKG